MAYRVHVYEDSHGKSEIKEWIQQMNKSSSKMDKSILKKLYFQVGRLESEGFSLNEPVSKKMKGYDLYELRPVPYRIFYATFKGDEFVLLHYFYKKSNKTPQREIEKAKNNLADWIERNGE